MNGAPLSCLALSHRARSIEVSPTVGMAQQARKLKAEGRRVLDFSVGEPDQPTPAHIVAAATRALAEGDTRYSPATGTPELRKAVVQRYAEEFGVQFEPGEAAITIGGKQALYLACQALLDSGDEMLLPAPYWPTFTECARLAGARPLIVETDEKEGFAITAQLLEQAVSPKTRAILINCPSNPTGAVVAAEDLLAVARLCSRRQIALLYDDTYARLSFDPIDTTLLARVKEDLGERFVIVGTRPRPIA